MIWASTLISLFLVGAGLAEALSGNTLVLVIFLVLPAACFGQLMGLLPGDRPTELAPASRWGRALLLAAFLVATVGGAWLDRSGWVVLFQITIAYLACGLFLGWLWFRVRFASRGTDPR
jgi:hypothetical protein